MLLDQSAPSSRADVMDRGHGRRPSWQRVVGLGSKRLNTSKSQPLFPPTRTTPRSFDEMTLTFHPRCPSRSNSWGSILEHQHPCALLHRRDTEMQPRRFNKDGWVGFPLPLQDRVVPAENFVAERREEMREVRGLDSEVLRFGTGGNLVSGRIRCRSSG
jgi:hypothetical protein